MQSTLVDQPTAAPNWDASAEPIAWSKPGEGQAVVFVKDAIMRNAKIREGHFLVADVAEPIHIHGGIRRIKVECYWFGKYAATHWINLTVFGTCKIVNHYTGKVITDIGRRVG